jgi:hypothetical protein
MQDDTQELGQACLLEIERDALVLGITVTGSGTGSLHEDAGALADRITALFFLG